MRTAPRKGAVCARYRHRSETTCGRTAFVPCPNPIPGPSPRAAAVSCAPPPKFLRWLFSLDFAPSRWALVEEESAYAAARIAARILGCEPVSLSLRMRDGISVDRAPSAIVRSRGRSP